MNPGRRTSRSQGIRARPNQPTADLALLEIARLLARQAAREWSEPQPDINDAAPRDPCSEKRS